MVYTLALAAAVFFAGHALRNLFTRLRLPPALAFLALGAAVAPFFGEALEARWAQVSGPLGVLALGALLYRAGLVLRFHRPNRDNWVIPTFSLLVFAGSVAAVTFAGLLFQPLASALLVGLALGAVSTLVVSSLSEGLLAGPETGAQLEQEGSLTEVLALGFGLLLVQGYAVGVFDPAAILTSQGAWLAQSLALGLGAGVAWLGVERWFSRLTTVRFAPEACWLLCLAGAERLGFSGPLAALALGFVQGQGDRVPEWLGGILSRRRLAVEEVGFLADTLQVVAHLFFIHLGMELKWRSTNYLLFGSLCFMGVCLVRGLCVRLVFPAAKFSRLQAMSVWVTSPRGLGALALASLPVAVPDGSSVWFLRAVGMGVFVSWMATTLGLLFVERPNVRVALHRLFGPFREDFGLGPKAFEVVPIAEMPRELPVNRPAPEPAPQPAPKAAPKAAPAAKAKQRPKPEPVPAAAPVAAPEKESLPKQAPKFPELSIVPALPAEDDTRQEPTLNPAVDLSLLEFDEDESKRANEK